MYEHVSILTERHVIVCVSSRCDPVVPARLAPQHNCHAVPTQSTLTPRLKNMLCLSIQPVSYN